MVNRDLLKEAIADAKAVKETAIANAKAALEEAFTPMMQEKFAKKIAQLDEEDDTVEEGESREERANVDKYEYKKGEEAGEKMEEADNSDEIDLEELLRELDEMEADENLNEGEEDLLNDPKYPADNNAKGNVAEVEEDEDYTDEDADGIEDSEDEEIDIENMDESDLKSFIESVIADMVAAGELEGGEGAESEEDEEVEINERKKQGYDDREDEKLGMKRGKMGSKDLKTTKARRDDAGFEKKKMKENYEMEEVDEAFDPSTISLSPEEFMQAVKYAGMTLSGLVAGGAAVANKEEISAALKGAFEKVKGKLGMNKAVAETDEMEAELNEAYKTIKIIQTELQEVNLFNAKLLYTNKIFKAKTLTESQKVKVLAAFDKAASVKEAKLVFETLSEGFKEKKSPVNESLLRGSASRAAGVADKKPILEVNDQYARWQTLAGIKK